MDNIIKDRLRPVLTEIGKQASFRADTQGMQIKIKYIAIGTEGYAPEKNATSLKDERLRVEIQSSEIDKDNYQITLNSIFRDSSEEFWIREVGVFLEDGTLFAVWSDKERALSYKSVFSKPIFSYVLKIVDINIDTVKIIDNGLDLKLNYLKEFTLVTNSISKLSLSIMSLHDKIKKSVESFSKKVSDYKLETDGILGELKNKIASRNVEIDRYILQTFVTSTKDNLHRLEMFYKNKER